LNHLLTTTRFTPILALLATAVLSGSVLAAPADTQLRAVNGKLRQGVPQSAALEEKLYIVQLDTPPAMSWHRRRESLRTGNKRSLADTVSAQPRFNAFDPDVQLYTEQLERQQDRVLARLGLRNKPVHRYRYTFNGFAVKMTELQAEKLRNKRGVAGVWEDRLRYVSTIDSPEFLGLNDADSGLSQALGLTGEDVIIGVIDSGIAIDHPSFSDKGTGKPGGLCGTSWAEENFIGQWLCASILKKYEAPTYGDAPEQWNGECETGTGFDTEQCNNKLIGARFYREGFEAIYTTDPNEFISPRDADGHGTHIASIAAGNEVTANIGGQNLGTVRGMAPRARVAVYKACWLRPGAVRASCAISDLQSAVEDAVADGVDIINYSVGDLDPDINDPDDLALLTAAHEGILTVAASGNEGDLENGSINSPGTAPWVITVGASSRSGTEYDTAIQVNLPVSLADDYIALEASFTPTLRDEGPIEAELLLADDGVIVTPDGEVGSTEDGCSSFINATEMNGKIALIRRGGCNFDLKIANAGDAGAVAALIYNDESVPFVMDGNRDAVTIPAMMIGQADGTLFRDELANDQTIDITMDSTLFIAFDVDGNDMASFSSTGPNLEALDILKPDVTAPGVNILGGQTPDVANGQRGEEFQYLSGTSMSVPHVAGVAALLRQANPDWTPAEIKSALMTSARQNIKKSNGEDDADPFDMGAGHIEPNDSATPGLVYPADLNDYDAFLCGTDNPRLTTPECDNLLNDPEADPPYSAEPYDLNLPSVAISELVSVTTVQRRVINRGDSGTYTMSIDAPDGIDVEINPASLSLDTDEEDTFEITFSNQTAERNVWKFGSYTWSANGVEVRSPFAVRPVTLGATEEVVGTGIAGSSEFNVQFGFDGEYEPRIHGLNKPCVLPGVDTTDGVENCNNNGNRAYVANDPFDFYELEDEPPAWVSRFFVEVPADQLRFRVRLYNEFTEGDDDDLDVYVYHCGSFIGETCLFVDPRGENSDPGSNATLDFAATPGVWLIDVHGFETDPANADAGTNFRLHTWTLGRNNDVGNLSLTNAPVNVTYGSEADITVEWSGLDEDLYFGGISHSDDPADPGKYGITLIDVDARPPAP